MKQQAAQTGKQRDCCSKQLKQQQLQMAPSIEQPFRQTAVTLAFKDTALESRFSDWYNDAATAHDLQVGVHSC